MSKEETVQEMEDSTVLEEGVSEDKEVDLKDNEEPKIEEKGEQAEEKDQDKKEEQAEDKKKDEKEEQAEDKKKDEKEEQAEEKKKDEKEEQAEEDKKDEKEEQAEEDFNKDKSEYDDIVIIMEPKQEESDIMIVEELKGTGMKVMVVEDPSVEETTVPEEKAVEAIQEDEERNQPIDVDVKIKQEKFDEQEEDAKSIDDTKRKNDDEEEDKTMKNQEVGVGRSVRRKRASRRKTVKDSKEAPANDPYTLGYWGPEYFTNLTRKSRGSSTNADGQPTPGVLSPRFFGMGFGGPYRKKSATVTSATCGQNGETTSNEPPEKIKKLEEELKKYHTRAVDLTVDTIESVEEERPQKTESEEDQCPLSPLTEEERPQDPMDEDTETEEDKETIQTLEVTKPEKLEDDDIAKE